MTEDPFAHLHDEGYEGAYSTRRVGWESLVHMGGRAVESLCGDWHFTPDLFDEGLRQRWFANPAVSPSEWTVPLDADLWGSDTLPVPGCWTAASGRPEWAHFEGAGWYARTFDWRPEAVRPRLVLRVGAASYEARVFLNGVFIGSHRGGSTPFCIELTGDARPGLNRLLIQVDNRRRADRAPMHHFDWFNHGGLHREVGLLALPSVFIRRFAVWRDAEGIGVEIGLSDPVDGVATVEAWGQAAQVQVIGGTGRAVLPGAPEAWSPEAPHLHDVAASFGADRVTDRVGFRTLATRGGAVLLNGAPIFLRGMCVHEDDRELGRVATEADMRRRAAHAKELGCNALRLAHYPHHEGMARIADEVGLLLWCGDSGLLGDRFRESGDLCGCGEPVAGDDRAGPEPGLGGAVGRGERECGHGCALCLHVAAGGGGAGCGPGRGWWRRRV